MTFGEFLELTEDAKANDMIIVDVGGGRHVDIIDVEVEIDESDIIIRIED